MKIAFYEIRGPEKTFLRKSLKGHTIEFFKEPLTPANVKTAKGFDVISIFIYSKLTKQY